MGKSHVPEMTAVFCIPLSKIARCKTFFKKNYCGFQLTFFGDCIKAFCKSATIIRNTNVCKSPLSNFFRTKLVCAQLHKLVYMYMALRRYSCLLTNVSKFIGRKFKSTWKIFIVYESILCASKLNHYHAMAASSQL